MRNHVVVAVSLAALGALAAVDSAEARVRGAGGGGRVRERTRLDESGAVSLRRARLQVGRDGARQQSMRLRIDGAPAGLDLDVFVADRDGALARVGGMREEGASGEYAWQVRTRRGDPLPFGVADVADLSGRAIEVRTTSGERVVTGTMPSAERAPGMPRRMRSLRSGLAAGEEFAEDGVAAHIRVDRHHDVEALHIGVEHAPPGLTLMAWIEDAERTFTEIGTLVEAAEDQGGHHDGMHEASGGKRGKRAKSATTEGMRCGGGHDAAGEDEETDHPATGGDTTGDTTDPGDATDNDDATGDIADGGDAIDDNDIDEDDTEDDVTAEEAPESSYGLTFDAESGLPLGVATLADLAGLLIEIRLPDGTVLASGYVPDAALPEDHHDGMHDGDAPHGDHDGHHGDGSHDGDGNHDGDGMHDGDSSNGDGTDGHDDHHPGDGGGDSSGGHHDGGGMSNHM